MAIVKKYVTFHMFQRLDYFIFILANQFECMGGCSNTSFCDYGICRCNTGYDALYGSCWDNLETFTNKQELWNRRQENDFNPYISCSNHHHCKTIGGIHK